MITFALVINAQMPPQTQGLQATLILGVGLLQIQLSQTQSLLVMEPPAGSQMSLEHFYIPKLTTDSVGTGMLLQWVGTQGDWVQAFGRTHSTVSMIGTAISVLCNELEFQEAVYIQLKWVTPNHACMGYTLIW